MGTSGSSYASRFAQLRHLYGRRDLDLFFALSLLCGGSGEAYPLVNAFLQLFALVLLARYMPTLPWKSLDSRGRLLFLLFAAAFALMLAQMVPLPPEVWHALPGRQAAVAVYDVLGWQSHWHAMSLSPDMTLKALLALLAPLAMMVATVQQRDEDVLRLLRIVVGTALLSAVFSAFIISGGPVLYRTDHAAYGVGFFVNRNHQAVFLDIALVLSAVPGVVVKDRHGRGVVAARQWPVLLMVFGLLALGVLSTTSRAGLALLAPALAMSLFLAFRGRISPRAFGLSLVGVAMAALLLLQAAPTQAVLARYDTAAEDLRFEFWKNAWFAARAALPWGYGFGSFRDVYQTVEALDALQAAFANRAHNDFLEILMDGGIAAILLVAIGLGTMLLLAFAAVRRISSRSRQALALSAFSATFLLVCASVVDYPLRMEALAVVAALCAGNLARLSRTERMAVPPHSHRAGGHILRWFPIAAVSLIAAVTGLADHLRLNGALNSAAALAPWSAEASGTVVAAAPPDSPVSATVNAAYATLRVSPLDQPALRTIGISAWNRGDRLASDAKLSTAVSLGWRDGPTQIWAANRASELGQAAVAVQRLDALLRIKAPSDPIIGALAGLLPQQAARSAIAERLMLDPQWRTAFFAFLGRLESPDPIAVKDLVSSLDRSPHPVSQQEIAMLNRRLWALRDYGNVRDLWQLVRRTKADLANGEFDDSDAPGLEGRVPYAWRALHLPGVVASFRTPETPWHLQAMYIATDGVAAGRALMQSVALTQGVYRFTYRYHTQTANLPSARWVLHCVEGEPADYPIATQDRPARDGWIEAIGYTTVPPECSVQTLAYEIIRADNERYAIYFDEVSLVAAQP